VAVDSKCKSYVAVIPRSLTSWHRFRYCRLTTPSGAIATEGAASRDAVPDYLRAASTPHKQRWLLSHIDIYPAAE